MTRLTSASPDRGRSRSCAVVLALSLLLTATACSEPAEPARWDAQTIEGFDIPAIDWPLGAPDTTDEHTALVINAETALAVAFNNHDFSDPYLTSIITEDYLEGTMSSAVGNTGVSEVNGLSYYPYHPGPRPVRVTKASTDSTTGALTLTVCTTLWGDWVVIPKHDPVTSDDPTLGGNGIVVTYTFENDLVSGQRLAENGGTTEHCDAATLQTGFFDPAPPYGQPVQDTDLLGLDGQPARDTP